MYVLCFPCTVLYKQAADTQNVAAYVKRMVEEHAMEQSKGSELDSPMMVDVRLVAKLTQKIAYENKEKLQAGMIIAGWDRKRGGQVYGIPLGGSMLEAPFSVSGSGSAYIYGYLDNTYKEDMTREECEEWMTNAISLAIARDASSGGVIRLVTIHEHGCEKKCVLPKDHKVCDGELPQKMQ
jgi:20S proteasome subunit beta 1